MQEAGTMQREMIKWIQSLDLTYQVRHPQQDLSNGFTLAEIVSRYDRGVSMHSYVPGCSSECKRRNWKVLLRDLKRLGCTTVTAEMAEATAQGKPGVASAVLDNLYEFFCGRRPPPRLCTNNGNTTALLNALDSTWVEKHDLDAVPIMSRPLPLRAMENDDIALAKGVRQPGFARLTASALLHFANRETRNAPLIAAVPPDELRVVKRNEKLLNEHEMMQKAYRYVEPQRFALVSHHSLELSRKKVLKGMSSRNGSRGPICRTTLDKVSRVEVNVINKRILGALRMRESNISEAHDTEDAVGLQVHELLLMCDNKLRVALPKLLAMALESEGFSEISKEFCGGECDGDVFCMFVGRRGEMPFAAILAFWKTLLHSADSIALALLARPTEYMYLLRALNFIFGADVARIRLLHVSSLPQENTGGMMMNKGTSGISRGGETLSDDDGNARGRYCRSEKSEDLGDTFLLHLGYSEDPKQALFLNSRVFSVASAYSFFVKIGEALHAASPSAAVSMLMRYFIPVASPLFSSASAATLEAIACVVVAHVCGNESVNPVTRSASNESQSNLQEQSEGMCWSSSRELSRLLTDPIKTAFLQTGPADSVGLAQRRTQYNLFLYHVFRRSRIALGVEREMEEKDKYEDAGSDSQQVDVSLMGVMTPGKHPHGLVKLCALGVHLCLGSSSLQERSIGLAMLLQIIIWDRWDLAIDSLVIIINDMQRDVVSSGFLQRAAATWESRVLLLELLTITFRKALYLIADISENLETNKEAPHSPTGSWVSMMCPIVLQKLHFDALEGAIAACLLTFSDAPLLQRQLALQIVGRRLLPEEQRNVAAVWLRSLFVFPLDQLEFLLRPHEAGPQRMPDPTASAPLDKRIRTKPSNTQEKTTVVSGCGDTNAWEGQKNELPKNSAPEQQRSGGLSDEEMLSSVRVLLGRVEPAYVVAPLNQSWDTFGVVQTVLMYDDLLSTAQVFSIVLAALLSPQRRDEQGLRLLQNLRAVAVVNADTTTTENGKRSGKLSRTGSNKSDVDDFEVTLLNLSLENLAGSYNRKGVAKHRVREAVKVDEDAAAPASIVVGEETSSTMDAARISGDEGEEKRGDEVMREDKRSEPKKEEEEQQQQMVESHVTAFWLSVLRLLKPQLQACLASDDTNTGDLHDPGAAKVGSSGRSVCRISQEEDLEQLQSLARNVLLALYSRYGTPSPTQASSTEAYLSGAQAWLDEM